MKVYATIKLSKGYKVWKAGFDELGPEMRAFGISFVYVGCEADNENKVHMIVQLPSMETAWKILGNPEIQQKRVEAGVILESQIIIPLAD